MRAGEVWPEHTAAPLARAQRRQGFGVRPVRPSKNTAAFDALVKSHKWRDKGNEEKI